MVGQDDLRPPFLRFGKDRVPGYRLPRSAIGSSIGTV